MSVLQMQRISICALKKDRKAILEKIQSMGVMEMNQIAEDEEGFEKMPDRGLRRRRSFRIRRWQFLKLTLRRSIQCYQAWRARN